MKNLRKSKIAVIGLGYVGLSLANVTGFDIDKQRITALKNNIDHTREISQEELKNLKSITYTNNEERLADIDIYIITIPTPVDAYRKPAPEPLKKASHLVGKYIRKGAIVIYDVKSFFPKEEITARL